MGDLALTGIFASALFCTIYFFGKLMTWVVYKIAPQNCEKEFTKNNILITNLVMLLGIILWSILFYSFITMIPDLSEFNSNISILKKFF